MDSTILRALLSTVKPEKYPLDEKDIFDLEAKFAFKTAVKKHRAGCLTDTARLLVFLLWFAVFMCSFISALYPTEIPGLKWAVFGLNLTVSPIACALYFAEMHRSTREIRDIRKIFFPHNE